MLPKWGHILENSDIYKLLYFLVMKSYNIVYMGWCLVAFVFLKYERWIVVYGAVNYYGFVVLIGWAAFYHSYRQLVRGGSRREAGEETKLKEKNSEEISPATGTQSEEKKPEEKKAD